MPGYYNVNCPKEFGLINFLRKGHNAYCPVSGAEYCFTCDVIGYNLRTGTESKYQVKKIEKK